MVSCPPPLGCMKNSLVLPIRVSLNQDTRVTMATHMTFITRHLATQMFRKQKITADAAFSPCRSGQTPTICSEDAEVHKQASAEVKNRWSLAFKEQPFHTDGAGADLYCVRVWERWALSGVIPPGRTANCLLQLIGPVSGGPALERIGHLILIL